MNSNTESQKKSSHETESTESLYSQYYSDLLDCQYYRNVASGVREDIGLRLLTPEDMTCLSDMDRLSIEQVEQIREHVLVLTEGWSLQRILTNWSMIQFSLFGSSRAAGAIIDRTPRWQQSEPPEDESEDEEFARVFGEEDSDGFSFADMATDPEKKKQYEEEQTKKRPKSRWDFVPSCWQEFLCNSAKGLVDGFVAVVGRNKPNGGGFVGYVRDYFPRFVEHEHKLISTTRQTLTRVKEYDLPCLGIYRGLGSVPEYSTKQGQVRTTKARPMTGMNLQVALVAYEALESVAMWKYKEKFPLSKVSFFEALPEHKNSFAVRAFNHTFKYLDLTFGSPWKMNAKDGYPDTPHPEPSEQEPTEPDHPEEEPTPEPPHVNTEPEQPEPEKEEVEPIQVAAIALEALANSGLDPALIAQTKRRVKPKVEKRQAEYLQERQQRTDKEKDKNLDLNLKCNKLYGLALSWKRDVIQSHGSLGRKLIQIFSEWEQSRQRFEHDVFQLGDIDAIARMDLRQLKQEVNYSTNTAGSVPFWQSCFGNLSGILQSIGTTLKKVPKENSEFINTQVKDLHKFYESLREFSSIASQLD